MQTRIIAYSPFWRVVVALLVGISRGSLLALLAALLFFETRLDNQLRLFRTFVVVSVAPGLAAWLVARACAATVAVEHGLLGLQRRGQRIEIPCEAITAVVPWTIPLPAGGVWLRLRSGRRFPFGLQLADPVRLIEDVAAAGAPDAVRVAVGQPAAVYERSRHREARRWYHPILKFPVLALVPAVIVFRLHQWIAYGGTFGEYYTYGLQAYLLGFGMFWSTFTIYLVLYAAVLRTLAETTMAAIAWTAPARVEGARRITETVCRVAYFSGVPAFLLRLALLSSGTM